MCMGGSAPAPVKPRVVQPAPSRDTAAEAATAERRRVRTQQGVYGNVFTSVLGDPGYDSSTQQQVTPNAAQQRKTATLG